jgi:hypothetical protein
MTWFIWRQFRAPTWIAAGALAVVSVLLAITGHNLADQWAASGATACNGDCSSAFAGFLREVKSGTNGLVYQLAVVLVYVVPALIGSFWGAPLIARELEAGTHRLVWNQSITRTRWLATKLAMVGAASAITAGLLSWGVSAWSHHIDHVGDPRTTPLIYGARGIVPIGYALFAFAVGVTAGMLLRRTVPAMAATLGIYVAAVVAMPLWIRGHLAPAIHVTSALDTGSIGEFTIGNNNQMSVLSDANIPGAWVLSNRTLTPTGKVFTGPANMQACGPEHGPKSCMEWVGSLGLRQDFTYQPASHFWPLQWAETGIFVAVAALLVGFCFWWTRRRLI